MNINRKNIIIAVAAALLLLCICILQPTKPETSDKSEIPTDAVTLYTNAVNAVNSLSTYTINSHFSQSSEIDHEVFTFDSEQSFMIYGHGTKIMNALGIETITAGNHTVTFESSYANGNAYLTADDKQFHSPMSPDVFLSNITPAVMLDSALYESVTVSLEANVYTVSFSGATAPEKWAVPDNAVLLSASGTAVLSEDLHLTQSSYTVTYSQNGVTTKIDAASTISYDGHAFTVPVRADSTKVDSVESIRLLEIACGYTMQANTVLSKINESILCQAYGDSRTQLTRVKMNAANKNCVASIRMNTTLSNYGKADAPTEKSQWIQYRNGQYQQSIDGSAAAPETGVAPDMMKTYCQDYFLSTLIQSKFITGATVTEKQNTYRFEYTASDSFAHQLCQSASQILYQDPALLFTVSDNFSIESTTAFLEIDKHTALPVSSGISCSISHTVGGFPYQLQYSIQQEYDLPSAAAARLR